MAEALLRHVAKSRPALETLVVGSAGTIALSGNLPVPTRSMSCGDNSSWRSRPTAPDR